MTGIAKVRPSQPLFDPQSGTLSRYGELYFNSLVENLNNASSGVSAAVLKSDYVANTVLAADTVSAPHAVSIPASSILGRTSVSAIIGLSASQGRTVLGLGTVATQDANNVIITGGSVTGITDLAVSDGGTGASTATGAQSGLGLQIVRATSQFDQAADTTLATVTGLTVNIVSGKSYQFTARLFVDASALGGQKYAIAGSATASAVVYQVNTISNTANVFVINSRQTSLGGTIGQTGATANFTEISGTISCSGTGNLVVQFAQNAGNGTSSVLVGSTLEVREVA